MTVKIPKTALGLEAGKAASLSFKWADNADVRGNVMAFMELGDTAPNDRFVFTYTASTTEDERDKTEETESDAVTETPTDTPTETPTDTPTEPSVGEVTDAPTEAITDGTEKKGCKSSASLSAGILVTALMAAAAFRKRKE